MVKQIYLKTRPLVKKTQYTRKQDNLVLNPNEVFLQSMPRLAS